MCGKKVTFIGLMSVECLFLLALKLLSYIRSFCAFFSPFNIFCEFISAFVLYPGTNILIYFQAAAAAQFLNVMGSYMESLCSDLSSHTITNVQSNNDRVGQSTIKILLSSRFFGIPKLL